MAWGFTGRHGVSLIGGAYYRGGVIEYLLRYFTLYQGGCVIFNCVGVTMHSVIQNTHNNFVNIPARCRLGFRCVITLEPGVLSLLRWSGWDELLALGGSGCFLFRALVGLNHGNNLIDLVVFH